MSDDEWGGGYGSQGDDGGMECDSAAASGRAPGAAALPTRSAERSPGARDTRSLEVAATPRATSEGSAWAPSMSPRPEKWYPDAVERPPIGADDGWESMLAEWEAAGVHPLVPGDGVAESGEDADAWGEQMAHWATRIHHELPPLPVPPVPQTVPACVPSRVCASCGSQASREIPWFRLAGFRCAAAPSPHWWCDCGEIFPATLPPAESEPSDEGDDSASDDAGELEDDWGPADDGVERDPWDFGAPPVVFGDGAEDIVGDAIPSTYDRTFSHCDDNGRGVTDHQRRQNLSLEWWRWGWLAAGPGGGPFVPDDWILARAPIGDLGAAFLGYWRMGPRAVAARDAVVAAALERLDDAMERLRDAVDRDTERAVCEAGRSGDCYIGEDGEAYYEAVPIDAARARAAEAATYDASLDCGRWRAFAASASEVVAGPPPEPSTVVPAFVAGRLTAADFAWRNTHWEPDCGLLARTPTKVLVAVHARYLAVGLHGFAARTAVEVAVEERMTDAGTRSHFSGGQKRVKFRKYHKALGLVLARMKALVRAKTGAPTGRASTAGLPPTTAKAPWTTTTTTGRRSAGQPQNCTPETVGNCDEKVQGGGEGPDGRQGKTLFTPSTDGAVRVSRVLADGEAGTTVGRPHDCTPETAGNRDEKVQEGGEGPDGRQGKTLFTPSTDGAVRVSRVSADGEAGASAWKKATKRLLAPC